MRKSIKRIGAALAVLALCALLPAAFHFSLAVLALALSGLAVGTITTTYVTFLDGSGSHQGYAGGTTPPTAAAVATKNTILCTLFAADADTTGTITCNFGLSAAQAAALEPFISWYVAAMTTAASTAPPQLAFSVTTNTGVTVITVTKGATTNTGGTYVVQIARPAAVVV